MKVSDPMLQAWGQTLAERGDLPAVLDESGRVLRTFAEIDADSKKFDAALDEYAPGTTIGVQIGNDPDWPSVFLACLRRRLVTVPMDRSMSAQERDTAVTICRASLVIGRSPNTESPQFSTFDHEPVEWGEQPPCLLKLTSGTTAAPRAIRFRSEQLIADCVQICDTMRITETDLTFGVI